MKKYNIYAKNKCLFESIEEGEFNIIWQTLQKMVGIMKTDYCADDLHYQEIGELTSTT